MQPVPALTGHVVDQTGTLSAADTQALEALLAALEQTRGAQVVVL
ncbi:MAG: YgcG family protein, partial [Zoogloea sp.]|nr:YgcG family protein [Zoogloea sp.]